jgi:ADP-L-glycero-D-manno-heptose 6-epimerase
MSKALVTGGAGFIGSNLALELEKEGLEVTVLDDFSSAAKENLAGFKGELIAADVCQLSLDHKFDYIFHQAAITDPRYGNDHDVYEKNLTGFERVLDLALRTEARLIYASTAGLYGNGPVPMREAQPKDCLTTYGQSKLKMDEIAETYFEKLPVIGLRYFNVFGPREAHKGRPASMVLHLMNQMTQNKRPRIFTRGEQKRDFVYVKDVVRANLIAMKSPSGIFNVGTGIGTSFNELVDLLNYVLNKRFEPEYFDMPYDPATYQANTQADITHASQVLGFSPTWDLKTSVSDYFEIAARMS